MRQYIDRSECDCCHNEVGEALLFYHNGEMWCLKCVVNGGATASYIPLTGHPKTPVAKPSGYEDSGSNLPTVTLPPHGRQILVSFNYP